MGFQNDMVSVSTNAPPTISQRRGASPTARYAGRFLISIARFAVADITLMVPVPTGKMAFSEVVVDPGSCCCCSCCRSAAKSEPSLVAVVGILRESA